MKIFELIKNPLIKIPAILLIIYFGLFHDKRNPESLGNRLSSEKIRKNFSEAKDRTRFIAANVHEAQAVLKERKATQQSASDEKISAKDVEIGSGEKQVACGDVVKISHAIYDRDNNQLEFLESQQLVIGSKSNSIVERNIIGMKNGGVRNINIPGNFKTDDEKLAQFLRFNGNLKYQVTLLDLQRVSGVTIPCDY